MFIAAVNFSQGFSDSWTKLVDFLPKLIGFLGILVVGLLIARVLSRVISRVLNKVGFDRAVERGGIRAALARSDVDASTIVGQILYLAGALIVLEMAFGVFGSNPVSDMLNRAVIFLPKIFAALIIVVIALYLASTVNRIVGEMLGGLSYGGALAKAAAVAIGAVGVIMALDQMQIAPAVVNGFWYAILAALVGTTIVAVGGSGIGPLRSYWERSLGRLERENETNWSQARAQRSINLTDNQGGAVSTQPIRVDEARPGDYRIG